MIRSHLKSNLIVISYPPGFNQDHFQLMMRFRGKEMKEA